MSYVRRAAAAAGLVFVVAFAGLGTGSAAAMTPQQCMQFTDYAMKAQAQYYARGCAPVRQMHAGRDQHYRWCMSNQDAVVRADLSAKGSLLKTCLASRSAPPLGPGFGRPPAARPACAFVAGYYNGRSASIVAEGGDRIRVMVSPTRPIARGSCVGNRLIVDFTDDHVISGIFDGRVIRWDNRTNWVKN